MDILDCRVKAQEWSDKYNNNAYIFEDDSGYNFTYCQTKETIIIITPSYKSMKEINGHKYSKKYFPNYKVRYKVEFEVLDNKSPTYIDIYSTNDNETEVMEALELLKNKVNVLSMKIIHKATKEQDNKSVELIKDL